MEEQEEREPKLTRKERRALKKAEKKRKIKEKRAAMNRSVRLFPPNKKGYHIMPFYSFLRNLFFPIHWLVFPYRLHGHKKVGKGACIYFGNHYTIWDIFYPARTTREGIHFLAKQSVLESPVLCWWGSRIGAIGAMRDGSDVRTVMEAMRALKNGDKVSMFPEGTRNKASDEEFLPFHGGAALLAIKTKSPVVPFVICNRPKVFHMTHIMFGEPMELSQYYGKKITAEEMEEAENVLRTRLYELREDFRASRKKGKKKGETCK